MTRKTVVIPMVRKKKHHGKSPLSVSLAATQFALERAVKEITDLKRQYDGLAQLDKEKDIRINYLEGQLKRLRDRVERSDCE